jgi:phage FluMu protein Com
MSRRYLDVFVARCLECGTFLMEHGAVQDISLTCDVCRGVNIFCNSTEPVEYRPPRVCRDVAPIDHRHIETQTSSTVVRLAEPSLD